MVRGVVFSLSLEFDFGEIQLRHLISKCSFPWLLSNVVDGGDGKQVAGTLPWSVKECAGIRFGFVGLVEVGR